MRSFALIMMFCICSFSAAAEVEEVRVGVLAQSCCGPAANKEEGAGINAEIAFSSPRFLSVLRSPRPVIGVIVATDSDATNIAYTGLDWTFALPFRLFLSGGGGIAIHDGETSFDPVADASRVDDTLFLGCRALFRSSAELGRAITGRLRASVYWSHISNAGLCSENEGLDHLGARLSLTF